MQIYGKPTLHIIIVVFFSSDKKWDTPDPFHQFLKATSRFRRKSFLSTHEVSDIIESQSMLSHGYI